MSGLQTDFRVAERDVELVADVPAGTCLAVIGPNGAGKSTLLHVIAGLLAPDRGRVVLGDRVLTDTSAGTRLPAHQRRIGLLAQSGLLFEHLSVLENVAFGPRSKRASRAQSHASAREWLERLGVADLAERNAAELSGGQAQRVALARTLAAEPDALLLDEPTAALDVRVAAGLRSVLGEVTRGRTTVLVSHDLLDIVSLADHVLVIEAGRVAEYGETAQVLARPNSAFAARLSDLNILRGQLQGADELRAGMLQVHGLPDDDSATSGPGVATVRPAAITISLAQPETSARNVWPGTIATMLTMPHAVRVRVDVGGTELAADVTAVSVANMGLAPGTRVWLSVKAQEVAISPAASRDAG